MAILKTEHRFPRCTDSPAVRVAKALTAEEEAGRGGFHDYVTGRFDLVVGDWLLGRQMDMDGDPAWREKLLVFIRVDDVGKRVVVDYVCCVPSLLTASC